MDKGAKLLLFWFVALALLATGCISAEVLWHRTHPRYDMPNSGFYYGSVNASFSGTDEDIYSFSFTGETEPHWRWTYPTNIIYKSLQFERTRVGVQTDGSKGRGIIFLPSLIYESPGGTGVLTRALLSEWLIGTTNGSTAAARSVDAVFGFIEDAGRGTLPVPNHHGYSFEQPVRGRVQHFLLGFGVCGLVYVWVGIWLLSVVFFARRYWRNVAEPNLSPEHPPFAPVRLLSRLAVEIRRCSPHGR